MSAKLFINNKKSMNFKPLSNHLFLEPIEEEKTTASGIVLPDTAEKEKPVKLFVLVSCVVPAKIK